MDLSREVGPWLQKPKAVFPKDLPIRLKKLPGVMAAYFSVKTKFSCRKPLKMIVRVWGFTIGLDFLPMFAFDLHAKS